MFSSPFFDLSAAYKNFVEARDCSKLDLYPGIYQLLYVLAFGGCGIDESTLATDIEKIKKLGANELLLLGINNVTYPFLLIAVHKSIIYGKMKYTDVLIQLAKKVLVGTEVFSEDFLNFYEKIFNILYNTTNNKDYVVRVVQLSEEVRECTKDVISEYKCKILAILGDLDKFDKIRSKKSKSRTYLYRAIDSDLNYISKRFEYKIKLRIYKNILKGNVRSTRILRAIIRYDILSGILGAIAYLISDGYFHLPVVGNVGVILFSTIISSKGFKMLVEKFSRLQSEKAKEKYRIIPVLLQI